MTYQVTYTQWSEAQQAHIEQQTRIYRDRALTDAGVQRIVRRDAPGAIVVRVERIIES